MKRSSSKLRTLLRILRRHTTCVSVKPRPCARSGVSTQNCKRALRMQMKHEWSVKEISQALNISQAAAKSRLYRARQQLFARNAAIGFHHLRLPSVSVARGTLLSASSKASIDNLIHDWTAQTGVSHKRDLDAFRSGSSASLGAGTSIERTNSLSDFARGVWETRVKQENVQRRSYLSNGLIDSDQVSVNKVPVDVSPDRIHKQSHSMRR